MQLFNDCIVDMAHREIACVGVRFTWTNKQVDPTRSVLDWVLVSIEWKAAFPFYALSVVTQIGSDHPPIILIGEGPHPSPK